MRSHKVLRGIAATLALVGACSLMACGANAGRTTSSSRQTVEGVLQEQANQDGGSTQANPTNSAFVGDKSPAFAQVDYDLTTMSSDMVYATVNDMMTTPNKYVGKTVRMKEPFQHSYYDATKKDYFYVVIQDATACCSQGLEFVWGDGGHAYPNEYPAEGQEVIVTGTFRTYEEEGTPCMHLVGASVEGGVSVGHKRDLWQESLSITLHCHNNRVQYICTQ